MSPIKTARTTHRFTGGPGVMDLYVECRIEDGVPVLASFWRPSEEDIANILAGGVVELCVMGGALPPVRAGVVMP